MIADIKKESDFRERGFTLIEAAIVTLILGLVMVPLFGFMTEKRDTDLEKDMTVTYERITTSLEIFLKQNGRYPCPANPAISVGAAGFGDEDCGITGIGGTLRGSVPTSTLSIPYRLAGNYDNWKLQYAVTETQTDEATYNGTGNIEIVDINNRVVATDVAYVVIDPGRDGKGSFAMTGVAGPACGTTARDAENCDNDARYRDMDMTDRYSTANAQFYDDKIHFELPREDTGFWLVRENPAGLSGLNIVNKNPGNIGIGVPSPSEKLHVGGAVRIESDGTTGGLVNVERDIRSGDVNADVEIRTPASIISPSFSYETVP